METPEDFVEAVLYPAFNDRDDIALVDTPFFDHSGGMQRLEVTMDDGSVWQLTVSAKP